LAARCVLSLLPGFAKRLHFESSGSITSTVEERSRIRRLPFPQRILTPDMILYTTYVVYASLPVVLRFSISVRSDLVLFPFPGVMLKLFASIWKAAVPILYMAFPPSVEEWKELTSEDEDGVRRPIVKGIGSQKERLNFRWMSLVELVLIWLCL
jgi:hypothetical protein